MRHKSAVLLGLLVMFATVSSLADKVDDAERLHDRFVDRVSGIKRLNKTEVEALVKAICEAEEDERQSVARDVSSRVRDHVRDEYEKLDRLREEALKAADDALADDSFKDKHSKIRDWKQDIRDRWETVTRMTQAVRGSNHPVVAYMLEGGQQAHYAYQHNSSYCDEYEYPLAGGKADCLNASACRVIELKPNNSRSIYKGRDQVKRYVEALNNDPSEVDKLISKNSKFQSCKGKSFDYKVEVYQFCPEIDDEGNFRSLSVGWSED